MCHGSLCSSRDILARSSLLEPPCSSSTITMRLLPIGVDFDTTCLPKPGQDNFRDNFNGTQRENRSQDAHTIFRLCFVVLREREKERWRLSASKPRFFHHWRIVLPRPLLAFHLPKIEAPCVVMKASCYPTFQV